MNIKNIDKVISFLNGNYSEIINELTDKMQDCSERMEYEEAARYRDLLISVKQIAQKQKITADDATDRDVIACAMDAEDAVVQVFFIRQGKLLGREHFHMKVATNDSRSGILSEFMKQYYGGTPYIPNVIMTQEEIEDAGTIADWLSSRKKRKVTIITPRRAIRRKWLNLPIRMHLWY